MESYSVDFYRRKNFGKYPCRPKYKEIEDYKEAKAVMKSYLETVIDIVDKSISQNTKGVRSYTVIDNLKNKEEIQIIK